MSEIILETLALSKQFQGFTAVDKVDLKVRRGTIHALIGPNGAGKSTMFNLITKFLPPTSGRIAYEGQDITNAQPEDIALKGLVRSFQISAVFRHLSVRENVRIALQRPLDNWYKFWQSEKTLEALNDRADELIEDVGLSEFSLLSAVKRMGSLIRQSPDFEDQRWTVGFGFRLARRQGGYLFATARTQGDDLFHLQRTSRRKSWRHPTAWTRWLNV